jgi:predicted ATPase
MVDISFSSSDESSPSGIQKITIKGFKSISNETSLDIGYLTIFAGPNSSGKSSFFQSLLLMKQTLEENIDPGVFSLEGSHVGINRSQQIFSKITHKRRFSEFSIKIELSNNDYCYLVFKNSKEKGIETIKAVYETELGRLELDPKMSTEEIFEQNPLVKRFFKNISASSKKSKEEKNLSVLVRIVQNRCFLDAAIRLDSGFEYSVASMFTSLSQITNEILRIIHIPPVRGTSQMLYKYSAVEGKFPGTFEYYIPSIINHWKNENNPKLQELKESLDQIGLAWSISTHEIDDTTVELMFPLSPKKIPGRKRIDWIRITDLGFGVSQVLPVLVALIIAKPEQIVYIEQPEIHLHPQAQLDLAKIIVKAADRGVRVVLETHSDLLILGIQTIVADGGLSADKTRLHWFSRNTNGSTTVNSSFINEDGSFDNWPHDFGKINLIAKARFLDASDAARQKKEIS